MKYRKPDISVVGNPIMEIQGGKALNGHDHEFDPDILMTVPAYNADE
jgi:hypothetical protein